MTVNAHATECENDPNRGIAIAASHDHDHYDVKLASGDTIALPLMTKARPDGLTMEALLAVVLLRLKAVQSGEHPCDENARAFEHVASAIHNLQSRTRRLAREKMIKDGKEPPEKERVYLSDDNLQIGTVAFNVTDLQAGWAGWSLVERACRMIVKDTGNKPLTPAEMGVLQGIATTSASRNGFTEVQQALRASGAAG
jgi:hypothetical protein